MRYTFHAKESPFYSLHLGHSQCLNCNRSPSHSNVFFFSFRHFAFRNPIKGQKPYQLNPCLWLPHLIIACNSFLCSKRWKCEGCSWLLLKLIECTSSSLQITDSTGFFLYIASVLERFKIQQLCDTVHAYSVVTATFWHFKP